MTQAIRDDVIELAKYVRAIIRAENRRVHEARITGKDVRDCGSRDEIDLIHVDLLEKWPAKRLDALLDAMRAKEQSHSPTEATGNDVERFVEALEAALLDGFTPELEQVLLDTFATVRASLSPNGVSPKAADKLEAMQAALENIVEATKYVENPYARDAHKLARAALNLNRERG